MNGTCKTALKSGVTALAVAACCLAGCTPDLVTKQRNQQVPEVFSSAPESKETVSSAKINWREFFQDPHLITLIESSLANNQELNIFLQEIEIAKNEATARSGAYLPFVDLGAGAGFDKSGRYTRFGALEANNDLKPGKPFPEPLQNYSFGMRASWEVDIWRRLRNAEKSAINRFLATQEGRNFLLTNLIAEVANSYYELRALDSQLEIVEQNIDTQSNALKMVKLQKQAARVTELAIRRFEAQVLKTRSLKYEIQQKIIETENRINFLLGRFPQSIARGGQAFVSGAPRVVQAGLPSQLLENRPDIRQAELEIAAADLDVQVAKAAFYPSLNISAEAGYEAYRLRDTLTSPESLIYNLFGNLTGPFLNRRAITADYLNANAKQVQAIFGYERTVLGAFIDVSNQVSNVKNLGSSYDLRSKQVQALTKSIEIANVLFNAARADYTEVLLTQRDALESRFELIETKKRQMVAYVNLYRALGGGWT